MTRVCYLVQAHRDPRLVARLVATLGRWSPGALVVVAHDDTGCAIDRRALPCAAELHLRPIRGPIRRGYLSMLLPWLETVGWLERSGLDYDWLVYLSGQDYPTRPLAVSEAALAAAGCDGYIRWWPALGPGGPWRRRKQGLRRYFYRYYEAPGWALGPLRLMHAINGVQGLVHLHLDYGPRVGVRALSTPFTNGRVCYAGWQWTTLRRACAEAVLAAVEREHELVEHYRRTICPDESLVQTLVVGDGRFRLVNDNRRYADTTAARHGRPRLLGVEDLERITCGAYDFARKFDLDHDPRVLDLLDERLAGGLGVCAAESLVDS